MLSRNGRAREAGILARLFLLVVIALAPITAIQIHDELDYRRNRERELHAEALRLTTLVGMEQDRMLEGARQMLSTIAALRAEGAHDPSRGNELLGRLVKRFPYYDYITTVDLKGEVMCSSTGKSGPGASPVRAPFFWTPLTTDNFAVGASAVTEDGTRVLQLGFPIRAADGTAIGMVLAGLRVDWIMSDLAHDFLPRGAVLTIADRNGIVIARLPATGATADGIGNPLPPNTTVGGM
jgi:hypothetical protein